MIRLHRMILVGAAMAAATSGVAFAHHNTMDGYDANAPVVLTGEISSIDWSGEHALVHIKTADGKSWKVQAAPVKTMRENGLDEAAFGAKDKVVIRGYQSKDKVCKPECLATGADVTFADGLKMKLDGTHAKDGAKAVHDQRVAARAKLGA
jgi:Family of unknown function (DUF6152)